MAKIVDFKKLEKLYEVFKKSSKEQAGYPTSQVFDYSSLFHFMEFHINNAGDPFGDGNCNGVNTLKIERELIEKVAEILYAPKDNFWGYVTTGGTEGNLYGLYLARETYPDGVCFYSEDTHYSVPKCLKILRVEGVKVRSQPNGEIDYYALKEAISNETRVPIILANIGTTMKGAVDEIQKITRILKELGITKYYIHCDAAFFGMILPFITDPHDQHFDFRMGIHSISISGHKLIGTPMPCGIVIVLKDLMKNIGNKIEYISSIDNTITGSRSGISPLFLWYEINCSLKGRFHKLIDDCLKRAEYSIKRFEQQGIRAWRNENSMVVVFPRPLEKTIKRWQLAIQDDIAHIITLPQVTYKVIDQIVHDVVIDLKKITKTR